MTQPDIALAAEREGCGWGREMSFDGECSNSLSDSDSNTSIFEDLVISSVSGQRESGIIC